MSRGVRPARAPELYSRKTFVCCSKTAMASSPTVAGKVAIVAEASHTACATQRRFRHNRCGACLMDLYLVRHGVAFDPDPARWPDDTQRPLTPEGEKRVLKAARGLGRLVAD